MQSIYMIGPSSLQLQLISSIWQLILQQLISHGTAHSVMQQLNLVTMRLISQRNPSHDVVAVHGFHHTKGHFVALSLFSDALDR